MMMIEASIASPAMMQPLRRQGVCAITKSRRMSDCSNRARRRSGIVVVSRCPQQQLRRQLLGHLLRLLLLLVSVRLVSSSSSSSVKSPSNLTTNQNRRDQVVPPPPSFSETVRKQQWQNTNFSSAAPAKASSTNPIQLQTAMRNRTVDTFPLFNLNNTITTTTTTNFRRTLQQSSSFASTYYVNYSAHFQVLRDTFCISASPVIHVACSGPNIRILNISHSSISCFLSSELDPVMGYTYFRCTNTCTNDDECSAIYLAIDGKGGTSGPYGSVEFQCAGNDIQDVAAYVYYEGSRNTTTNAAEDSCAMSTQGDSRIYHFAQLGVSCPSSTTTTGSSTGTSYNYDDYFFDCIGGAPLQGDTSTTTTTSHSDRYTCTSGDNCGGKACTMNLSPFTIYTSISNFQSRCIDSSLPLTNAPTPSVVVVGTITNYTTRFAAAWGILYDAISNSTCTSVYPTITISCLNEGTINFVNATASTIDCSTMSNGHTMLCTDTNRSNIFNRFTGVSYECSSSKTPETRIDYPESAASCNGNTAPASIRHAVQLGIYCASTEELALGVGDAYFDDVAFECVDESHRFDYFDVNGKQGWSGRYTCFRTVSFPAGSLPSQPLTIPNVAMSTDRYWIDAPEKRCATPVDDTNNASTVPYGAPTIPVPTSAAVPPSPSVPLASGSGGIGSFTIGVAIGGAGVAIAFALLVVYFVLHQKAGRNSDESSLIEKTSDDGNNVDDETPSRRDPSQNQGSNSGHQSNSPSHHPVEPSAAYQSNTQSHHPADIPPPPSVHNRQAVVVEAPSLNHSRIPIVDGVPPSDLGGPQPSDTPEEEDGISTTTSRNKFNMGSGRHSQTSSGRFNPENLQYKDQAGSHHTPPLVNAVITNAQSRDRQLLPQQQQQNNDGRLVRLNEIATVVASPVDDSFIPVARTSSNRSNGHGQDDDSARHRGLEP